MHIHTIEGNFDYQAKSIFKGMKEDYEAEQNDREGDEKETQTFSEWLWKNKEDLGERFYEAVNDYLDIDEFTENLNV